MTRRPVRDGLVILAGVIAALAVVALVILWGAR